MIRKYVKVAIKSDTKIKLDDVGKKGETDDQKIQKLLSKWNTN